MKQLNALVYCQANEDVGHCLLALAAHFTQENDILSVTDILTFNLNGSTDCNTFSLIWFLGKAFMFMWIRRCEKKNVRKVEILSELEAHFNIMGKTSFTNSKVILREFLNFFTNF